MMIGDGLSIDDAIVIYERGEEPSDQEGIILLGDVGHWYTNQTGGVACHHPTAQGLFLPLQIPMVLQELWYNRYRGDGDYLTASSNAILRSELLPFTVVEGMGSEEAWVFVRIGSTISGDANGILTWENSD